MWGILSLCFGVICLLFFSVFSYAQHSTLGGLLPRLNVSVRLSEDVKLIAFAESRQGLYDTRLEDRADYEYILTDMAAFLSFKMQANQSFNIGYTHRIRGDEVIHRMTQQFNIVVNRDAGRIGHRFVFDQTYSSQSPSVYRLRYRIVLEKSLSGDKIDSREFYMKIGTEALGNYTKRSLDLEWRMMPMIGYEINRYNRIEFGPDYRLGDVFSDQKRSSLWLSLTWYISI